MSRSLATLALAATVLVAACGGGSVTIVTPATAVKEIAAGSRTVIDVRTPGEFAAGHIAGAINIDVEAADFGERITELDPAKPYLVYCRTGRRSAIAAQTMADAGFTEIHDAKGFAELAAAGAPTE